METATGPVEKQAEKTGQMGGRLNKLVKWRGRLSPMETAMETGICLTHTPSQSVSPSVGTGISLTHTPSPSVSLTHTPSPFVSLTHTQSQSVSPSVDMGICLTHLPSQSSVVMGICPPHT